MAFAYETIPSALRGNSILGRSRHIHYNNVDSGRPRFLGSLVPFAARYALWTCYQLPDFFSNPVVCNKLTLY